MIQLDTEIYELYLGNNNILELYSGYDKIFPSGPVDNTGFLKYYPSNFRIYFLDDRRTNPQAPYSFTFKSIFQNDFLDNVDYDIEYYVSPRDEIIQYQNNFDLKFINNVVTGEADDILLYDNYNFSTEFLGEIPSSTADYDQYLVYNSSSILTAFLDDASTQYYETNRDTFLRYKENFDSSFLDTPITINLDFTLIYDNTNIATEFLGEISLPTVDYDQYLVYNYGNIISTFKEDSPVLSFETNRDTFLKYQTNFQEEFYNEIVSGEVAQVLLYNNTNMSTEFLGTIISLNGIFDQTLNNINDFYGPDAFYNPFVSDKDEVLSYKSNFSLEFFNPPDTGVYDQDIAYGHSNIAINFI